MPKSKRDMARIQEARGVITQGVRLAESAYARHIEPVAEVFSKHGRDLEDNTIATMAYCMENFRYALERQLYRKMMGSPIAEATTSANIKFANWAFDLIAAIIPNLLAEELFSVQPMERRKAQIFYLDILAETDKGGVSAGDKLATPESGYNGDYTYPTQLIDNEQVDTGDGGTGYGGTLAFPDLFTSTLVITAEDAGGNTLTLTDNGAGVLTGNGTGTIAYDTGIWTATFSAAIPGGNPVLADYEFHMENYPEKTPEVKLDIRDEIVQAITIHLGASWLLDAAYDLQLAHGKSAENTLMQSQAGIVRRALDTLLMDKVRKQAAGGLKNFYTEVPTGISKHEHFEDIKYTLNDMSDTIAKNTRLTGGNYIMAGKRAHTIIRSLDDFESKIPKGSKRPTGSYISGVYQDYTIVFNPDYPNDEFVMGAKGENYLEANFIYAPYIPFYTTEIDYKDFFKARKGMGTAFGQHMVRSNAFVKGKIIDS